MLPPADINMKHIWIQHFFICYINWACFPPIGLQWWTCCCHGYRLDVSTTRADLASNSLMSTFTQGAERLTHRVFPSTVLKLKTHTGCQDQHIHTNNASLCSYVLTRRLGCSTFGLSWCSSPLCLYAPASYWTLSSISLVENHAGL